jgi:hypothetical protein
MPTATASWTPSIDVSWYLVLTHSDFDYHEIGEGRKSGLELSMEFFVAGWYLELCLLTGQTTFCVRHHCDGHFQKHHPITMK